MKFTQTLTTAAPTQLLCNVDRRRGDCNAWQATVFFGVGAAFNAGGSTVILQYSPDGGTTKYAAKDFNGTAISGTTTASEFTTQPMGNGSANADYIQVYATLSVVGSGAVVPVVLFDNR